MKSLMAACAVLVLTIGSSSAEIPTQSKPILLKGGLEHTEHMKPLPTALHPGAVVNPTRLKSAGIQRLSWAKIPPWAAGKWQRTTTTTTSQYDFRLKRKYTHSVTYSEKNEGYLGTQMDDKGNIWQALVSGRRNPTTHNNDVEYESVLSWQIVEASKTRMIERLVSENLTVDSASNRIRSHHRSEIISTRRPLQDGVVRHDDSRCDYDSAGNPIKEVDSWSIETRTKRFEPQGGDQVRHEFLRFLRAQNKK